MFEVDQAHGLKYIHDRFERYGWKFLYEKRNDIRDALRNIFEIDSLVKRLRKEDPATLHLLHSQDPAHVDHFLDGACRLVGKIIELMKHEERDIVVLEHVFRKHELDKIAPEKRIISNDELPEERYAEKLERWARYMDKALIHVYRQRKNKLLRKMRSRVKRLVKDMVWFEGAVEKELSVVKKAREAEQFEDLLRGYRHSPEQG